MTRKQGSFRFCPFSLLTQVKTIGFLFLPVSQTGSSTSLRSQALLCPFSFFLLYLKRCCPILYRLASNSGNPPGSVYWTVRTKPFASSSITTDNLCNIIYSTSNISPSYIHIIKPIVQVAAANAFNLSTSKAQAGSSPSSKPAGSTQRNLVWGLGSGDQQNGIFQPRYGASVTNFRQSLNMLLQSALVVNAFNPSTREARAGRFLNTRLAWSTE